MSGGWQFWIDRGGTFTDVVARSPSGELQTHKLLSENPERYADAAIQGVRDVLGLDEGEALPSADIDGLKMGTTVATNALLERKGQATLLLITRGFADQLRIGYQHRPDLFARAIELPEMLYREVIEVDERLAADGSVLESFKPEALRPLLVAAHERGLRSVAVALLHGYRNPEHEKAVGALAREVGFEQVSLSHVVSPLMKLVSRGDTTVVDAYLSPILRRYVDQVASVLRGAEDGGRPEGAAHTPRLDFMQSHGGLTAADQFHGRDAILSGPAGGIVGAVRTAEAAGFDRLVTFDMGGTSTDVAHYAGEYERAFETEVAGVRMRVPMLHIHTVAAGGGSILHFDGARQRVGPDSAGANPGPACYRRGGPLTVTDANVQLGVLRPEHFPHVFGPGGDQPIDGEVVARRFTELATEMESATGHRRSPEQIADGFVEIAVANMAAAIRRISVQRGYDVTEYALQCFGGAGGQHACRVADALGVPTVLIHPFAGVLSAYGMGLAQQRELRQQAMEAPLDLASLEAARSLAGELAEETSAILREQDVDGVTCAHRLHLRTAGSDTALEVDLPRESAAESVLEGVRGAFGEVHRQRFGFAPPTLDFVIEAVAVEAVGDATQEVHAMLPGRGPTFDEHEVDAFLGGARVKARVLDRAAIAPGRVVEGPAVVIEETATTVVEPGWNAHVTERGDLLLERSVERAGGGEMATDQEEKPDPVLLEVFNNLFMSVAEQMGEVLRNTSYSVNIKERLDFSCAVFDVHGDLVANAPHMPVHLGSMPESVRTVIRNRQGDAPGLRPGDVYMLNSPYDGGTHLPDVTVVTPVFSDSPRAEDGGEPELLFFVASRGHHAEIGGITPGSMPPHSKYIDEEGVLIEDFLLVEQGVLREQETLELFRTARWPSRNPRHNLGDLQAQIAANEKGIQELRRLVDHFGLAKVRRYMDFVQRNAEESVRRAIDRLADELDTARARSRDEHGDSSQIGGTGHFELAMDNGAKICVAIDVDREDRSVTVDFEGTSPQMDGNFNITSAVATAAVLYVFRLLVDADIPLNKGVLDPITIRVPEGSLLRPQYPAAVAAGNVETSQVITDALLGALGVMAECQGTMNNFTFGNEIDATVEDGDQVPIQYYETICGGAGAGPGFDGASAVHTHMTNTRLTDPEVFEWRFPVRLESFEIRSGSGGTGRWRGGDGVRRRVRFLTPMRASILSNRRLVAPYGLAGGADGAAGRNTLELATGGTKDLGPTATVDVEPGDIFVIETPGGGGWGRSEE